MSKPEEAKDSIKEPSKEPLHNEEELSLDFQGHDKSYSQIKSDGLVPYCYTDLLGKIGIIYNNLQEGTNLQFFTVKKCETWLTSRDCHLLTVEAINLVDQSSCEFEMLVSIPISNKNGFSAITTLCRLKPQTSEPEEEEEDSSRWDWDKEAVDDFFKGKMPDWIAEDALMGSDKLQYYEIEEDNEWFHLYAELALFSKWRCDQLLIPYAKPFEMRKVVVRTREDVELKEKVKAANAIFYVSFKTRCGRECRAIIRKTTDRMPEHFSLEVKCLM